jgi:hypothetical protein
MLAFVAIVDLQHFVSEGLDNANRVHENMTQS